MRRDVIACVLLLTLSGCSAPELDGTKWRCSTDSDCGEGYLCNIPNEACIAAYSDENGIFSEHIVLGISAAITTGPTALGTGMRDGILAYFKHINDRGGVHDRQLDLVEKDDGYDPARAEANTRELTDGSDRQVFAIIGNVGTPTAAKTVPIANERKVPFFGAFTGAGLLRKEPPDRYIFNYRASYKEETREIVNYFLNYRGEGKIPGHNIAVIPQGENGDGKTMDGYGQAGYDGVVDALMSAKVIASTSDVSYWTYERNTSNVTIAIKGFLHWLGNEDREAKDGKYLAAVVMVPTYKPAAAFVKSVKDQLEKINANPPKNDVDLDEDQMKRIKRFEGVIFHSVSFVGSKDFAEELLQSDKKYCTNVMVTQVVPHYAKSNASGVLLYREHLAAYNSNLTPGFVSLEGYIAARLIVTALEQQGRDINTEAFINTLEGLSGIDLGIGTKLSFSSQDHQASHTVWGTVLDKDCAYQEVSMNPQ